MATTPTAGSVLAEIKTFIENWWTHSVAAAASVTAVAQTDLSHLWAGVIVAGSLAATTFLKYLKSKI